jgi:hypothetical protein
MYLLKIMSSLAITLVVSVSTFADTPTYSNDVAPILYDKCVNCHREGEIAPMPLMNYEETRPWAKSIRRHVSKRSMPPWFADPAHGAFSNDPTLSKEEIDTIVQWVKGGAPEGDADDLPKLPEFTEGWQHGVPDAIIELPEVKIPADGDDIFPNLMITPEIDESQWLEAIEIRPSNRDVAHHVVIFMNGSNGMQDDFDILGTWAVGTAPNEYPKGMGRRLKNGRTLIANMHYHPNGKATTDITRIGLYYGKGELKHEVNGAIKGDTRFTIPAGAENHEENYTWYIPKDVQIISMFPHMHLRGKDMRFTVTYPDGEQKILLDVPEYDFDWQLFYYPEQPINLPKGSKVGILAHYDNSAKNPANPNPDIDVGYGNASTDEMMFGIFEFIDMPKPDEDQTD